MAMDRLLPWILIVAVCDLREAPALLVNGKSESSEESDGEKEMIFV